MMEQMVKDRTIHQQRIIQYLLFSILILSISMLVYVSVHRKKIAASYKKLFEKNVEIFELQENTQNILSEKYKKSPLTDKKQNELLLRIYALMEDTSVVCDPDLSIEKLATLVDSNRSYVSQVLNEVLKKNFYTFIDEYRIREAQRLLSDTNTSKYTIETVAIKAGFKHRNTFSRTFMRITGVSPSFYLKSIQEK